MKILILTKAFPYPPGEQFIEDEICYWGEVAGLHDITLLPASAAGALRAVPAGVKVDVSCLVGSRWRRLMLTFAALFSGLFWGEVIDLIRRRQPQPAKLLQAWRVVSRIRDMRWSLRRWLRKNGPADLIYCYWNDVQSYAAVMLKSKGLARTVVARAHGFDLYEQRANGSYMPAKRRLLPCFDRIYVLSESARHYLVDQYGVRETLPSVRALGVPIPDARAKPSGEGSLNLVSLSFCVPVKRLDKIIDGLAEAARRSPAIHFRWRHLGGGPLQKAMEARAGRVLDSLPNVEYAILGTQPRDRVATFLTDEPVDCIINTSDSEGTPVSLMEAMSYGIPVIATDVGGVADLLDDGCGILMPAGVGPEGVADALSRFAEVCKGQCGEAARQKIERNYNAERNYRSFIQELTNSAYLSGKL